MSESESRWGEENFSESKPEPFLPKINLDAYLHYSALRLTGQQWLVAGRLGAMQYQLLIAAMSA